MPFSHRFQRVIPETEEIAADADVEKVIFCSGAVYYDLLEERTKVGNDKVALVRVEQLAPFPFDYVQENVDKYPKASVFWAQEEHKNAGAWTFIQKRVHTASGKWPTYIGRPTAAAPATGYAWKHKQQSAAIMQEAFA